MIVRRGADLQVILQFYTQHNDIRMFSFPPMCYTFKIIISIQSFKLNFILSELKLISLCFYIIGSQSINIFPMWFLNLYPYTFCYFISNIFNMTNTHNWENFLWKSKQFVERLSVLFAHAKSSANTVV